MTSETQVTKRKPMSYPKQCALCQKTIESVEDLDWHGVRFGNCVEKEAGFGNQGSSRRLHRTHKLVLEKRKGK
jgi:hypothetical protein